MAAPGPPVTGAVTVETDATIAIARAAVAPSANDIELIGILSHNPVSPTTAWSSWSESGWAAIVEGAIKSSAGVTLGRAGLFWRRAAGGETAVINTTRNGDTGLDGIHIARYCRVPGCKTSGDPWVGADTYLASAFPNAVTPVNLPSLTLNAADPDAMSFVLCIKGGHNANYSVASWTSIWSNASTTGTDGAIDGDYRQITAGGGSTFDPANPSITVDADTAYGVFHIMLLPPSAGPTAYELDCQPASYSVSVSLAGLNKGRVLSAEPVSYAVTPALTGLSRGFSLNAEPVSYAVSGFAMGMGVALGLNAEPVAFSVTPFAAGLNVNRVLNAEPVAYDVAAFDADLVYTPGVGGVAYELALDPAVFEVAAFEAGLAIGRALDAAPVSYTVTAAPAGLGVGRVLDAAPVSFVVTPFDQSYRRGITLDAEPASFLVTVFEAEFFVPVEDTYRITDFASLSEAISAGWRLTTVGYNIGKINEEWIATFEKYLNPSEMETATVAVAPGYPQRLEGSGPTESAASAKALIALNYWRDGRYDVAPHTVSLAPRGGHEIDIT